MNVYTLSLAYYCKYLKFRLNPISHSWQQAVLVQLVLLPRSSTILRLVLKQITVYCSIAAENALGEF